MKTYFGIHLFEVCHVAHTYGEKNKQKLFLLAKNIFSAMECLWMKYFT